MAKKKVEKVLVKYFCNCSLEFEGEPPITCPTHGDGVWEVGGVPPTPAEEPQEEVEEEVPAEEET